MKIRGKEAVKCIAGWLEQELIFGYTKEYYEALAKEIVSNVLIYVEDD